MIIEARLEPSELGRVSGCLGVKVKRDVAWLQRVAAVVLLDYDQSCPRPVEAAVGARSNVLCSCLRTWHLARAASQVAASILERTEGELKHSTTPILRPYALHCKMLTMWIASVSIASTIASVQVPAPRLQWGNRCFQRFPIL